MDNSAVTNSSNESNNASFKDWFNRPVTRGIVEGGAGIALAVYTALIREWSGWAITFLVMLVVVDLLVIVYYGTQTVNYKATVAVYQDDNAKLKRVVACDRKLIDNVDRSCEITINKTSDIIKTAQKKDGKPSLSIWNFKEACDTALHKMVDILREYAPKDSNKPNPNKFEIFYDKVYSNNGEKIVQTIACYTDETADPSIIDKDRYVATDEYYDVEFIRNNKKEILCLMNHDEVQENLKNRKRYDGVVHDLTKYNQMFVVPVFCRKDKLIGLLVISCLGKTVLAKTVDEAKGFIHNYVEPYLRILVVFYKIEKIFRLRAIEEVANG